MYSKYKKYFKTGYYTLLYIKTGEITNYKVISSYMTYEFRNIVDTNPYGRPEGTYIEKMISDADPLNGTISTESPLGKLLIKSSVGDVIRLAGEEIIILNVPKNI